MEIYPHHWKYVLEYFGVSVAMDQEKHPFDEDPRLYQLMPGSHSLWGRVQPYFLVQCAYFKKYPFLIRLAIPVGGAFLHDTRSVTFGARKAAN